MLTCGALVSLTMLFADTVTPVSFVQPTYAQENDMNTHNAEIDEIKQKLLNNEPINAEQLRQVPDDMLMTYVDGAKSNPLVTNEEEEIKAIYELIANYIPSLGLVIGEDYEAYQRVVDAITNQSAFTEDELKAVESKQLLEKYREIMSQNGENVGQTITTIEPWIQSEIEAYKLRETEYENSENFEIEDEEMSSENESLNEESEDLDQSEGNSAQLEQFSEEIVNNTPITLEQLSAIPETKLTELLESSQGIETDYHALFDQLFMESPEIFRDDLREIKTTLVEDYQLNPQSLDQLITDDQLLWLKWEIEEQMGEDYEQLALELVNQYQVERDTDTTLKYSSDAIRSMLIQETPITQEQLTQITDEELKSTLPENSNELVISDVFNQLVREVPEAFEPDVQRFVDAMTVQEPLLDSESLQENVSATDLLWTEYQVWHEDSQENIPRLAEVLIENYQVQPGTQALSSDQDQDLSQSQENSESDIDESSSEELSASEIVQDNQWRSLLIEETPMIQSQLDLFTDEELVEAASELENLQTTALLYDQLVAQYPERFAPEIERIKEALKQNSIDLAALENEMTDLDILWSEYETYLQEGQEDLEVFSKNLIEKYGTDVVDNTVQINDVKEQLLSETPMTEEQFGQFSEETITNYAKEVPSNDARELFDRLAKDFPEVFGEEATKLREALIEQTDINNRALSEVTDISLLWQAYQIVHQSEEINTYQDINVEVLLNQLVENGLVDNIDSVSNSAESSSDSSVKIDSRTGVEANSGNETKNSQSTELTPGANASFPELSSESSSEDSQTSESTESTAEQEDLPLTGERSPWFYFIAGIGILAIALFLLLSGRRRK